jgi:hypothetical protein
VWGGGREEFGVVVAPGWVHGTKGRRAGLVGVGPAKKSLGTLLGPEATRPLLGGVVALLGWWGVVFECWIVVASI